MHYIRTAEAMARVLDTPLDPELRAILLDHRERLAAYEGFRFEELAEFLIVERSDTLADSEDAYGRSLIDEDTFVLPAELVDRHNSWFEVTFILSDDGFGLVLLVEIGSHTDPSLLSACERALHFRPVNGPYTSARPSASIKPNEPVRRRRITAGAALQS